MVCSTSIEGEEGLFEVGRVRYVGRKADRDHAKASAIAGLRRDATYSAEVEPAPLATNLPGFYGLWPIASKVTSALAQKTKLSCNLGPGGKASLVRAINERAVLTVLRRRGVASKSEIADLVGLTTNTVGQICLTLEKRGLIEAGEKRFGLRGQPATPLRLASTGAYAIGIKLGRRTQQSLLIDFVGDVLRRLTRDIELPHPRDALALVAEDVATLRRAVPRGAASRLAGVGLAAPYNLDSWRRELDIPDDVGAAWSQFDMRAELAALIDVPVFLENDGTAAAAAELFRGHGRALDDFALFYFGYAIGGGLVLGGHVRAGRKGNAADFGLMPVAPSRLSSAAPSQPGRPDILLNRASGFALMRHLRASGLVVRLTSDLEEAIPLRPEAVEEWLDDCVDALIRPLFALSSLVDLQAVVLDGLLPRPLLRRIIDRLRPALIASAPEARSPPPLLLGDVGRDAAALGAAFLPFAFAYGREALLDPQSVGPVADDALAD